MCWSNAFSYGMKRDACFYHTARAQLFTACILPFHIVVPKEMSPANARRDIERSCACRTRMHATTASMVQKRKNTVVYILGGPDVGDSAQRRSSKYPRERLLQEAHQPSHVHLTPVAIRLDHHQQG